MIGLISAKLFNVYFSFIMLALGFWSVKEGVSMLEKHYNFAKVGKIITRILKTVPDAILLYTILDHGHEDFAVGSLSGVVSYLSLATIGCGIYLASSQSRTKSVSLDKIVKTQGAIVLLVTPLLVCVMVDGFCFSFGFIALLLYFGMFWFLSSSTVQPKSKDDVESSDNEKEIEPHTKGLVFIFIGTLIVSLYSDDFIDSFFLTYQQSTRFNGVFYGFQYYPLIAELPTIIDALHSCESHDSQSSLSITVANIAERCVSKLTLFIAMLCMFGYHSEFMWMSPAYTETFSAILISSLIVGLLLWTSSSFTKFQGVILMIIFAIFFLFIYFSMTPYNQRLIPRSLTKSQALPQIEQKILHTNKILEDVNLVPFL